MQSLRRLGPAIAAVLAVTLVGSVTTADPVRGSTVTEPLRTAAATMVQRLGTERSANGLVPLRGDSRLNAIAEARAGDMAARGYFSHTSPDGTTFSDLLVAAGITWYGAGETIAWNTAPDLALSIDMATQGWMSSTPHRDVLLSGDYNYVGVGAATAGDRTYWAAVVIKGPDRTPPVASIKRPTVGSSVRYGRRVVTVGWRATDPPLAVLTAGIRSYQLQWRRVGGSWQTRSWTTATSLRLSLRISRTYEFRVRARDRAGNVSRWTGAVRART
jgi:uncharacterized protein YkwD